MTEMQKYLVNLMESTLNDSVPLPPASESFNWEEFIKLAEHQDLLGILYPAVEKISNIVGSVPVMQEWRERIMANGAVQACLTDDLLQTLKALNESGMKYVVFKGLALKNLYPYPELRNMSDLDMLVAKPEVPIMEKALVKLGYHTMEDSRSHGAHLVLKRQLSFPIELHWTLWNNDLHKNVDISKWEDHIWDTKRIVCFKTTDIPFLSPEDELINLIAHFSNHLIIAFVSLRQIYDIALFLKHYGDKLDFDYIFESTLNLGLGTLLESILDLCKVFFDLDCGNCKSLSGKSSGKMIMEDILANYGISEFRDYVSALYKLDYYYQVDSLKKPRGHLHLVKNLHMLKKCTLFINDIFKSHLSFEIIFKKTITVIHRKIRKDYISTLKAKTVYYKRLELLKHIGLYYRGEIHGSKVE